MSDRNPLPYCLAHLAQLNPSQLAAWQRKIRCMRCGFEGSKAEFDEHLAPTDNPGLHIGRVVS